PPVSAEAGAYFLLKTYSALVSSATDTERTHQVLEDVFPPSVYIRLNPEHEACATELDDVNTADTLKRVAVDYLEANQPLIQRAAAALRGTNTPPTPATPAAALRPTGGGARASSPGCQRSASCSAPELPGDLPPPRETHPQPMHRRARSAGLTHGDSPPRSSGARGFRRSRWSGTDADEELASAADGAAELDDDSSPADSPSSAGESIARAHGGLRRRTSIEARPTAEAVLSAAVRRLVNEHLVSYLRAKPVGALARLVDAAASTMARSHGDFIRVQTFLSWLLRPFAEPETHHAGDLWVVVQPLAVIGGHEKVFIAFLTSAGLPSEVRKHGGRPWLAVHALALLPSALHCAAPSAAQAQARKRDQIEESMRWLAGVISALKDKASRVMLASGAVAGSPGGARAVPTRGADGDEALAPPPAARHEGGSHGQQLVRRVELEALDAKVERILRLIEAQAAATSGGRTFSSLGCTKDWQLNEIGRPAHADIMKATSLNAKGVCGPTRQAVSWVHAATMRRSDAGRSAEDFYAAGVRSYTGDGATKDYGKAVRLFHLAADQGHARAQAYLGQCYRFGKGTPVDHVKAVHYFHRAADKGHSWAQACLGDCYRLGEGTPEDHVKAVHYYRFAADQGVSEAQACLGTCYRLGEGIPEDLVKAAQYCRLAADQGHALAQACLGDCYRFGEGTPEDHVKAVHYFRLAADQGNARGQYGYAQCLYFGDGVPQDDNEAVRYYRLAADQGYVPAQSSLAQLYLHGAGSLSKDHDEGVRYHRLAADQNFPPSQLALGSMLIDDEHIPADECALEPALVNARAGARLLARAAQSTGPSFPPSRRLQALELLRSHADKREVVSVCCIGCGATEGLKQCKRCHVACFCGSACIRLSWRAHKQCCARLAEQGYSKQDDENGADESE
ncbi:hypothetical protein T492DRAFT_885318, partial [Pavlovales sp. CCMP2436]